MIHTRAELGLLVKLCREHRGSTQDQLAKALDLSRTAVAHLEQGLRIPEPGALQRLCEHLGLPAVLWEGFIPRDSLYPMAVRCHCRTYYAAWEEASADAQRRAALVDAVKSGEPWQDGKRRIDDPYRACATRLRRIFPRLFLNRTFVPVPLSDASASAEQDDDRWPALRLAQAYAEEGTACGVVRLFIRARSLRRSSSARSPKRRPTVAEHLATLALTSEDVPGGIVLVDDVTTRGTTLIACATRLAKHGWRGQVDALVVAYERTADHDSAVDGRELLLGWDGKWDYPVREG